MRVNSITILGQKIKVEYIKGLVKKESIWGDADPFKKKIRLEDSLKGKEYERVLRHEKMHMILGLSGITNLLPLEVEEAICTLIEIEEL